MTRAALAALLPVLVSACSFGGSPPRSSTGPGKAAIVRWLRDLDRDGVSFTLTGRVNATGHERQGEIDMNTGSVHLVLFDGVLYGQAAGTTKWLEMGAAQANFLWPAARLSLVWESVLLSAGAASPFPLTADQSLVLSGALKAGQGQVRVPPSLNRVEVVLDGRTDTFKAGRPDPTPIEPPAAATLGNVVDLLAAGVSA